MSSISKETRPSMLSPFINFLNEATKFTISVFLIYNMQRSCMFEFFFSDAPIYLFAHWDAMISLTCILKAQRRKIIRQAISLLVHFSSTEGPKYIATSSVFFLERWNQNETLSRLAFTCLVIHGRKYNRIHTWSTKKDGRICVSFSLWKIKVIQFRNSRCFKVIVTSGSDAVHW